MRQRNLISKRIHGDASTYIGEYGSLFYTYDGDLSLRVSDGVTPGGVVVSTDTAGTTLLEELRFDPTHIADNEPVGTLAWDQADQTLNIFHPGGVVQQVGQELYAYVINNTGSTIPNGTCVRFDGASEVGEARLEVAPFLGTGAFPSLYTLGVTTQEITNGTEGKVTVFGKIRDIDASGSAVGESWNVGDILYVSNSVAGSFTNVKPRAPNNVVPVAAVLDNDAVTGELFVRPSIEQKRSYGVFSRSTNATVSTINTADVIEFDTTEIANGVSIVGVTPSRLQVDRSGLYQVTVNAQIDVGGGFFNSGNMFVWLRVNGVDVPNSMRRQGTTSVAPSNTFSLIEELLLDVDDYVEIAYAGDDIELQFESFSAESFGPSTSSMIVTINQIQL